MLLQIKRAKTKVSCRPHYKYIFNEYQEVYVRSLALRSETMEVFNA